MESKYYTPTIEEFHIGFEYEDLRFDPEWKLATSGGTWYTKTVATGYSLLSVFKNYKIGYLIDLDTKEANYRVKYLDREDIESLGWEIRTDSNACKFIPEYTIGRFYLKHCLGGNLTIYDDSAVDEYCFRGEIKNKFELRKLMKQLNIE